MKRFLAILLTAVMLLGIFTSCTVTKPSKDTGGDPTEATEKPTEATEKPTEATEKPTESDAPTAPEEPEDPVEPDEPEEPTEPDEPADPVDPEDPTEPDEPADPVEPEVSKQYVREGNKIYFGSYPQTKVEDYTLTTMLNSEAGTLPTATDSKSWNSYKYYKEGSNVDNFMWYTDIEINGALYRGVYFIAYRPTSTKNASSKDNSLQDEAGYNLATVYWFKYEPISWTILSENSTNGTALILCDMVIDAREYYSNGENRTISGATVYPNNYAESSIRAWLNENFLNTAFSNLQKDIIAVTTVDNSSASTAVATGNTNKYASKNTMDKIFLLSYRELTNTSYGFGSAGTTGAARRRVATDYARAQGAFTGTVYPDVGWWWTRTPRAVTETTQVYGASPDGKSSNYVNVYDASKGVVPALNIKL